MAVVGFVLHHERGHAAELVREAVTWLVAAGHQVRIARPDAELAGLPEHGFADEEMGPGLDVAVSLGGDGTMLRTVDLVAGSGVPIIGVNVGQMGYLTDIEPAGTRAALERFLSGERTIEERMLLAVAVERAGGERTEHVAFNEAVLEKTPMGHTVRLAVDVDGDFFTTYAADGLIVATPTGSTAYAFSARGPIVAPTHRALLLTPVSPHMLFDRTLVLEPTARLRLVVQGHRAATLSVDGSNLGELEPGDSITCTAAEGAARLVTFGRRDFLQILKSRFGLEDR
ncbi:MAG: NAD(+)/NADH kinase [Acidimicrobiales bacterium]